MLYYKSGTVAKDVRIMDKNVEIRNLSAGYGRKTVLHDVNTTLAEGRIYGLLGRNGTGKSTLLKTLAGGLEARAGEIEVFGCNPFRREKKLLRRLMFVPQNISLPSITASRFVEVYAPFWPGFSEDLFREYAADLGVVDGKKLSGLSTGEQKRFMLAFAMATRSELTLLDEPLAGLDIIARRDLLGVIGRQDNEDGIIVLSSHDTEGLENMFTDLLVLDNGRLILDEPVDAIADAISFNAEGVWPDTLFTDGLKSISVNRGGYPSDIDLSMLFCAAVTDRTFVSRISNLINKEEICEK